MNLSILEILLSESGLPRLDLLKIIATAPSRYKVFNIPKRSGGVREIAQPARELKLLQRILVDAVLFNFPVHENAQAYRSGRSILSNATPHAGRMPILKMDFTEFFPRIRSEDWLAFGREQSSLSEEDLRISSNLLFRRRKGESVLRLSIGAPSSPHLSNLLMIKFDEAVSREAAKRNVSYSRYADDLTFSNQRIGFLKDMIDVVKRASRAVPYPHLEVNNDKTVFVTAASNRTVTGLVLANDGTVGLGRERKRQISASVHRFLQGEMSIIDLRKLAGNLAFANSVEPKFIDWLRKKYGEAAVSRIKHMQF